MSDLKNIKNNFLAKLNSNLGLEEINQIKTELFGKNGLISTQFKNIGSIPEIEKKNFASDLNQIKDELQNLITNKINEIDTKKINELKILFDNGKKTVLGNHDSWWNINNNLWYLFNTVS